MLRVLLVGAVFAVLLAGTVLAFRSSPRLNASFPFFSADPVLAQEASQGEIASNPTITDFSPELFFNVPATFNQLLTAAVLAVEGNSTFGGAVVFEDSATFAQDVIIDGQLTLRQNITGNDIDIDLQSGRVIASNLVYSVTAGSGISVSGDQDLVVTNSDKGSDQKIFKKIKVGDETIEADANNDQLSFQAGTGITLSRSGDEITIAGSNPSGWQRPSSGVVALVTASDKVGIGTATPTNALEIAANVDGMSGLTFTNLTSSATAGVGGGKVLTVDSGGKVILVQDQTGDTPDAEDVLPSAVNGGTLYFNGLNWVSSTNLFHDGGSVGISNDDPQARLHVNTNSASAKGLIVQGYTGQSANLQEWRDGDGNVLSSIDSDGLFNGSFSGDMNGTVTGTLNPGFTVGAIAFQGASGLNGDATNFFWDNSNKRLGIGTASTSQALTVNGNLAFNGSDAQVAHATSGDNLYLASASDLQSGLRASGHIQMIIDSDNDQTDRYFRIAMNNAAFASATELFRVQENGYMGLGTSSPTALLHTATTSTTFPTDGLGLFDWSPTSATTTTGDLFSLNVGSNGTVGNIFNVKNNGSSLFSVSQSAITFNAPTNFAAVGDMAVANDIAMTNTTASYIKSNAPLYLQAGEVFGSSDLTLRTFNAGAVVVDSPGGVTLAQAQAWSLPTGTSALNVGSGLLNLDTTNRRVGIGTATPIAQLDVTNPTGHSQFFLKGTGTYSHAISLGTSDYSNSLKFSGNTLDISRMSSSTGAAASGNPVIAVQAYLGGSTNYGEIQLGASSVGVIRGYGTGALVLQPTSGSVGIGTTGPSSNLHVFQTSPTANQVLFQIGTSDDSSRFTVDEDGDMSLDGGISGGNGNVYLGLSGTSNTIANLTNSQAALTLNQNGAGAVGGALTINTNAASPGILLLGAASQSSDYLQIRSNGGSGGNIFTVNSSGNVGIGTTDPGSNKLKVAGDFEVTGACTGCSSDSRLKTNVETISGSVLAKLLSIKGVTFEWSDSEKAASYPGKQYGVIAQDVEAVFPEMVGVDSRGYKFVRYDKLIAPTIEAIRAQQTQLVSIDGRLASYTTTLESLQMNPDGSITPIGTDPRLADLEARIALLEQDLATQRASQAAQLGGTGSIPGISTWINGVWTFIGDVTFSGQATFKEAVAFADNVVFAGRLTYEDKDRAGLVLFEANEFEARVEFDQPYEQRPIITLTAENYPGQYELRDVSQDGFTIWLTPPATQSATLYWNVISVKDAKQGRAKPAASPTAGFGRGAGSDIAAPADSPTPSPSSEPLIDETASSSGGLQP